MSARSIWKGTFTLGLVTIPVKAYKATDDPSKETAGKYLHSTCKTPINEKKICTKCNVDVPADELVKGIPQAGGTFVVLTPEELASIRPQTTDNIVVESLVDVDAIDPIYVRDSYFLTADGSGAAVPFAVLLKAMANKRRAAQGVLTIYGREQNVLVSPFGSVFMLQLMRTKTEVRSAEELPNYIAPGAIKVDGAMLKMAENLIDSLEGEFDPTDYVDGYAEEFKKLVAKKLSGVAIVPGVPATPAAPAIDLMAALQASLAKKAPVRTPKTGVVAKGKSSKRATNKVKDVQLVGA